MSNFWRSLAPDASDAAPIGAAPTVRGVTSRLARATAVYGLASFSIRAMNFLLIPLYTRYLTPTDYGIIYLAETVAVFLLLCGNLAADTAIQRLYFRHCEDGVELGSYLGSVVRFALATIITLLTMAFVFGPSAQRLVAGRFDVPFFPFIALGLGTAAMIQLVQYRLAIYQAARQPWSYAIVSLCLFGLTTIACVYCVVIQHHGAVGMLAGKLIATTFVAIGAAWSMRLYLRSRFRWRFVRETLAFGLPLVPHQIMAGGLIVADRFILEYYRDLSEVGIYSLAYTLGMVMFLVTQALSQAWVPMFFELAGERDINRHVLARICSGLAVLLIAIASFGILLSPEFVRLVLDPRYRAADRLVPLIVLGYLFHSLFALFHVPILQAKRTNFVFLASFVAFVANIALNLAWIPRWGMYGAGWATTLAYGIEAVLAYFFAQRFFSLAYKPVEIVSAIFVCGGALALTQLPLTPSLRPWALIGGMVVAGLLLAVIGKRDLWLALNSVRKI
jgi:O-antigen/teichoic acid export membrane protein